MSGSIPRQTATRLVVTFTTVQDIEEGRCPVCDSSYYVAGIHIGGHASSVPFVCCMNADGGWTHVQQRISDALFGEYVEHLRGIEEANEAWVKKLNDDLYGEVA